MAVQVLEAARAKDFLDQIFFLRDQVSWVQIAVYLNSRFSID
jgi:hypothetical protein